LTGRAKLAKSARWRVLQIEAEDGLVIDYRASTIHPPTLDLLEECAAAQLMVERGWIAPPIRSIRGSGLLD
jgi:hypothetical protein